MTVLTIRTDKPEAEVGLYEDGHQLAYKQWQAHRKLGETIHSEIRNILSESGLSLYDIDAVLAYKGPGSFTGLRIGLTVANTLAYSLECQRFGSEGDDWLQTGLANLASGANESLILPEYGGEAHITPPKP